MTDDPGKANHRGTLLLIVHVIAVCLVIAYLANR